ncbi:MAG TPA: hypothetical protein VEY09_07005 [Pyrinomonadaceae bacterium]|nr:hypothetical protein [Pyrinomonadaceae bacterium]
MSVLVSTREHEGGRARRGPNPAVTLSLLAASAAALGFCFVRYTRPGPGPFQKVLFFALLALIALELWQALRRRRPLTGGPHVRRVGARSGGAPSASTYLAALAFVLGFGGFTAFLWGTVGGLLASGEANFVWIGFGILGMLLGAAFALQEQRDDAGRGRGASRAASRASRRDVR